jgi:hypothetical protein
VAITEGVDLKDPPSVAQDSRLDEVFPPPVKAHHDLGRAFSADPVREAVPSKSRWRVRACEPEPSGPRYPVDAWRFLYGQPPSLMCRR